MVSKAVVSLVARVATVGLTALASSSASAAPSAPAPHHATTRAHAKPVAKSAGKPGARSGHAPRKPEKAVDRAEKEPPKQSLTPLPTIAAAMGTPLASPISTDAKLDAHGHGAEPGRSPDVSPAAAPRKPLQISTSAKKGTAKPPCLRDAAIVMRGTEEEKFPLTRCDGSVAPLAVEQLSILVRPGSAA
jgi:hypothetical protein